MSLFCEADADEVDAVWWWHQPDCEAPLATKRSRKCCSCDRRIGVGDVARKVRRVRPATQWEEIRGFGEERRLSDWYLCETCGDLADSLSELGFCYELNGESLKQQIADYRRNRK